MGKYEKRKKRRKLGFAVLGLVLAAVLAGIGYGNHLLDQLNFSWDTLREQMTLEEAYDYLMQHTDPVDPDYQGPEYSGADVELGKAEETLPKGRDVVNILLVGADYQGSDRARSDSMILCTFNPKANTVTLTSFMRDLYVQIPGYYKNRINASYAIGGMELLEETLSYNFGLTLDGIVEVDFTHFQDLIDLLGGVELELTRAEAEFINEKNGDSLQPGLQRLSGAQALWYSRFRGDSSGDFGRTNRQRTLLQKIAESSRDLSLRQLLSMAEDVLPMVTTDMKKSEILGLGTELFPMLMDARIVTQRIPAEGGYYMTRIDGMSVLVPDLEFNIEILKSTLSDE